MITRATPLSSQAFDRLEIANAAAELHRHGDRLQHAFDRQRVHRLAGKGAVEIDDMQIFKPLRGEGTRLRRRIEVEHGRARHVALFEAHALAVFQVDGGKEDHGFHFKKLEIRASPKRWLFSGWNCVPIAVSLPTIAVTGPPYSARASTSASLAALR